MYHFGPLLFCRLHILSSTNLHYDSKQGLFREYHGSRRGRVCVCVVEMRMLVDRAVYVGKRYGTKKLVCG